MSIAAVKSAEAQEGTHPALHKPLAYLLATLGVGLAVNSVLGPLLLSVIDYRFTESLVNQGIGLDLVTLALVVPASALTVILVLRGHRAAPPMAMAIAGYAAYMAVQYAIGPDYRYQPGNNEQFYVLHLAIFVVALATGIAAWSASTSVEQSGTSHGAARALGGVLLFISLAMVVRYLPPTLELVAGNPTFTEYRENATSTLLIEWMDLGVFTPAAFAAGVGLLRGVSWAYRLGYAILGWFGLVGVAVASMMATMYVNHDPNASLGGTIAFAIAGSVLIGVASGFYVRLFRERA